MSLMFFPKENEPFQKFSPYVFPTMYYFLVFPILDVATKFTVGDLQSGSTFLECLFTTQTYMTLTSKKCLCESHWQMVRAVGASSQLINCWPIDPRRGAEQVYSAYQVLHTYNCTRIAEGECVRKQYLHILGHKLIKEGDHWNFTLLLLCYIYILSRGKKSF